MAILLLFLSTTARAEDDCSAPNPDPGDPRHMFVQWAMGTGDTQAPELEIYVPQRSDITIEVEYRLGLDGASFSWHSGPWTPEPLDVIADRVRVPAEALWDPEQEVRPSSMTAEVSVWIGGTLVQVFGVEPLRVAFPYGAADPVFLDGTRMAKLAPGGVLLAADRRDRIGAWETIESMPPAPENPQRQTGRVVELEEN